MDKIKVSDESQCFNESIENRIEKLSALHSQALHDNEYAYAQDLESDINGLYEQKKFY